MSAPDLKTLQEWLSVLIQHPTDCADGARSTAANALIPTRSAMHGEIVIASDRQQPLERVDVYGRGYLARLEECLATDYSGLQYALGEHTFHHLAAEYVAHYPSQHPNLIFYGDHIPAFLAENTDYEHSDFLVELATLELSMTKAFHAPAFVPFDMASIRDIAPEAWGEAVFTANPSLSVHAFEYPSNRFLQAFLDRAEPQIPDRTPSFVSVNRQDYRVWRSRLTQPSHDVLEALLKGEPFGTALERAGDATEHVGEWFQDWAASGLFTDLCLPGGNA